MAPDVGTHSCLIQEFWPQSQLTIVDSEAMFFSNGDVREKFVADNHYIGPTRTCPASSFRAAVDCSEGYMVLIRLRDEEHLN